MPARDDDAEPCPDCGKPLPVTAARCKHCGAEFEDGYDDADEYEDDRPTKRSVRRDAIEPTDFIVPTNVSGWAIASCYLGLIGFCLPFVGLVFALPAFIFGIIALRKQSKHTSYGSVTGNIRAVIGLVLSGLAILIWTGLLVVLMLQP